jgi:hypothetical protein
MAAAMTVPMDRYESIPKIGAFMQTHADGHLNSALRLRTVEATLWTHALAFCLRSWPQMRNTIHPIPRSFRKFLASRWRFFSIFDCQNAETECFHSGKL